MTWGKILRRKEVRISKGSDLIFRESSHVVDAKLETES
jgi:hypothetical protein